MSDGTATPTDESSPMNFRRGGILATITLVAGLCCGAFALFFVIHGDVWYEFAFAGSQAVIATLLVGPSLRRMTATDQAAGPPHGVLIWVALALIPLSWFCYVLVQAATGVD
jgi:hypothetical protein